MSRRPAVTEVQAVASGQAWPHHTSGAAWAQPETGRVGTGGGSARPTALSLPLAEADAPLHALLVRVQLRVEAPV